MNRYLGADRNLGTLFSLKFFTKQTTKMENCLTSSPPFQHFRVERKKVESRLFGRPSI
jgi:hypothetical protein